MFVTPAYAQTGAKAYDTLVGFLPFVLIFIIFYFLVIRPQNQKIKKHTEVLAAIRRGDTVVTGGGLVAKVTRIINDNELEVDIGNGTKVTVVRSMLADVRVRGEPVTEKPAQK